MKLTNLIWIIVLIMSSCSKDSYEPIQLYYDIYNDKPNPIENNQISLLFPTFDNIKLVIMGGDGNYTVSNLDEAIVNVRMENKFIDITPLSIGSSIITVVDNSGNSYALNVKVHYREYKLIIDKLDVIVIGDKLSVEQREQIEQKAMGTIPIKPNGGYKFIYNSGDFDNGQVLIYKNSFDEKAIESTFEIRDIKDEERNYRSYIISINEEQRIFILNKYLASTKGDIAVSMALIEVLTEQFKTDYPNIELVYTQQRIKK